MLSISVCRRSPFGIGTKENWIFFFRKLVSTLMSRSSLWGIWLHHPASCYTLWRMHYTLHRLPGNKSLRNRRCRIFSSLPLLWLPGRCGLEESTYVEGCDAEIVRRWEQEGIRQHPTLSYSHSNQSAFPTWRYSPVDSHWRASKVNCRYLRGQAVKKTATSETWAKAYFASTLRIEIFTVFHKWHISGSNEGADRGGTATEWRYKQSGLKLFWGGEKIPVRECPPSLSPYLALVNPRRCRHDKLFSDAASKRQQTGRSRNWIWQRFRCFFFFFAGHTDSQFQCHLQRVSAHADWNI